MSDTVTPIRADVTPAVNIEREMRDWLWNEVKNYRERYGYLPHGLGIALLGDPNDGNAESWCNSWCPINETSSRFHSCAAASVLFHNRALSG